MILSPKEKAFLLALRRGKHFKNNPIRTQDALALQADEASPAGRHLVTLGYAARVMDDERPGAALLRITDAGISAADLLIAAETKPSIKERLRAIPFGKGVWDLAKIGLGVVLGAFGTKYLGR